MNASRVRPISERNQRIVLLIESGVPKLDVAAEMGITRQRVQQIAKKYHAVAPATPRRRRGAEPVKLPCRFCGTIVECQPAVAARLKRGPRGSNCTHTSTVRVKCPVCGEQRVQQRTSRRKVKSDLCLDCYRRMPDSEAAQYGVEKRGRPRAGPTQRVRQPERMVTLPCPACQVERQVVQRYVKHRKTALCRACRCTAKRAILLAGLYVVPVLVSPRSVHSAQRAQRGT